MVHSDEIPHPETRSLDASSDSWGMQVVGRISTLYTTEVPLGLQSRDCTIFDPKETVRGSSIKLYLFVYPDRLELFVCGTELFAGGTELFECC